MDAKTVALVQASFAKVWPIKGQAAEIFYADLFETAPSVKPLFAGANMQEQGAKLMATLNAVVKSLDHLDAAIPVARNLAIDHLEYGVRPEHYDAVGASLLRTLEAGLGPVFTPELKAAWTEAYTTLAKVMKEAAYSTNGEVR